MYSIEVENALYAHPAVLEAAAFGAPHPEWGEEVRAAVVLRPGATATVDELRQMLTRGGPVKACDEVDWTLFGLSMATYKVAVSLALGTASLWAADRIRRPG